MDVGTIALIALNNMLFAFLIWVLPRSVVVLAVALGQAAFFLSYMPSLRLSLEAGVVAFFKRWWFVPLAGAVVEVWLWLW